jgi:hypothetical protein
VTPGDDIRVKSFDDTPLGLNVHDEAGRQADLEV